MGGRNVLLHTGFTLIKCIVPESKVQENSETVRNSLRGQDKTHKRREAEEGGGRTDGKTLEFDQISHYRMI